MSSRIDVTPTTILAPFEAEHEAVNLTRNTKGSAWNRIGNNKLIDPDQWRYNYNPDTGIFEGRTIMGQWTNEVLDPLDPTTSNWNNDTGITLTGGQSTIFENQSSVRVDDDGSGQFNNYEQIDGVFGGGDETFHYIFEAQGQSTVTVGIRDQTASSALHYVDIDIVNETASTSNGSGSFTVKVINSNGPNGGKVFEVSVTTNTTSGNSKRIAVFPTGNDAAVAGSLYHYYAGYFEAATPPPTPVYGETAGQSYTQDPDIATVTDLDAIDFNPQEGTIISTINLTKNSFNENSYIFQIDDGTNDNRLLGYLRAVNNDISYAVIDGGSVFEIRSGNQVPTGIIKQAISYGPNGFSHAVNGSLVGTDTGAIPTGLTQMSIGSRAVDNTFYLNDSVIDMQNIPRRLSNDQLQQLTS